MSRECSATSLGMPGMSEGLHAKMSVLARRKSKSTTSYLLSSVALTCNALSSNVIRVEGLILDTFGGFESARVPERGVQGLACHLVEGGCEGLILC